MKIVPTGSAQPSIAQDTGVKSTNYKAAVAKLEASMQSNARSQQPIPLQNPNNISVEELGAIRTPQEIDTNTELEATEEVDQTGVDSQIVEEAPKKTEESLSNQWQIIARKEKALRAQQQQQDRAFKQREEALKLREAQLISKPDVDLSNYVSKQRLKESTLEALAEAQVSYDEITQQLINAPGPQDPRITAHISRLEARLAKQEAELEASKQNQVTSQQQQYQQALKQIKSDVVNLVKTDANFETVKATGSVQDVVDLIEQTFKQDGILLTVEEAAEEVENYLIDEAMKLTKIEKIKKRLNSAPAVQSKVQSQTPVQSKQPQPMRTLTNATSSTRQLSAKERAILAFKGELKS